MLEPIQGEAGVIIPQSDYLNEVKAVCKDNDWLFILDEVQSGMGRTGKLFAHQYNDLIPDVLCLAKGLGNGVPIGACLAKGIASEMLIAGTHGSTFGGNPLVCKVALSVLDVFEEDAILDNVNTMSDYINDQLKKNLEHCSVVNQIRVKLSLIHI